MPWREKSKSYTFKESREKKKLVQGLSYTKKPETKKLSTQVQTGKWNQTIENWKAAKNSIRCTGQESRQKL